MSPEPRVEGQRDASPAARPPVRYPPEVARARLAAHPLAAVVPLLDEVLSDAAHDCDAVIALSDASANLLWVSGQADVLARAAEVGLVVGASLDVAEVGTNALGASLAQGRPLRMAARGHHASAAQRWSGAACPIHDPDTGAVLGVLDVSGGDAVSLPQTLAMVRAAARMAESELARRALEELPPAGVPGRGRGLGRVRAEVTALVDAEATITLLGAGDRTHLRLTPRQGEIVVLLVSTPRGLPGAELAALLYPDGRVTSTLRTEMNRLRKLLGEHVLTSRPYRLAADVRADWLEVGRCLRDGDLVGALARYTGPLLASSRAPGVVRAREALHARLRSAVLESGRVDLMAAWTRSSWGRGDHAMRVAQREALGHVPSSRTRPRRPIAGPGLAADIRRRA